jgi:hypothetical protein
VELSELSELSRQTVDECLGHLCFPSKDISGAWITRPARP